MTAEVADNTNGKKVIRIALISGFLFLVTLITALIVETEVGTESQRGNALTLGGDFTLQSAEGPVSLSQFKGKVVLLYFGFLSCPEACPISMGVFQRTLGRLEASELDKVQPLLISIDPARDTPEMLGEYAKFFHPSIMGLTGTESEIEEVTKQYGAFFEPVVLGKSELDYIFDHTTRYYVIGTDGKIADIMGHGTTPNELAARIRQLL